MAQYRIPIHAAQPALRHAMRAYLWRRLRRRQIWIGLTVLLFGTGFLLATDGFDFFSGAAVATVLLVITLFVMIWRARWVATINRWHELGSAGAEVVLDDATFSVLSSIGEFTIPWSRFTEVWIFPGCWMLFTAPDQFQTVPVIDVPVEAMAFLRERLVGASFKKTPLSGRRSWREGTGPDYPPGLV